MKGFIIKNLLNLKTATYYYQAAVILSAIKPLIFVAFPATFGHNGFWYNNESLNVQRISYNVLCGTMVRIYSFQSRLGPLAVIT